MTTIDSLIDNIMNDLVSVNPANVSPFPYYPPYIRQVLEKHLKQLKEEQNEVEIEWKTVANVPWWDCPICLVFDMLWDNYCRKCWAKIKWIH